MSLALLAVASAWCPRVAAVYVSLLVFIRFQVPKIYKCRLLCYNLHLVPTNIQVQFFLLWLMPTACEMYNYVSELWPVFPSWGFPGPALLASAWAGAWRSTRLAVHGFACSEKIWAYQSLVSIHWSVQWTCDFYWSYMLAHSFHGVALLHLVLWCPQNHRTSIPSNNTCSMLSIVTSLWVSSTRWGQRTWFTQQTFLNVVDCKGALVPEA